jgi:hypothetical protein
MVTGPMMGTAGRSDTMVEKDLSSMLISRSGSGDFRTIEILVFDNCDCYL